jgi:hypothetical protein
MRGLLPTLLCAAALILSSQPAAHAEDRYRANVERCLANWKDSPFGSTSEYRVIESKVGVFGIGGDIRDDATTAQPELIYVRPSVSVMSKSVLELLNPNGWYCLEKNVSVMAKTEIRLQCNAHITSAEEGVSVMGGGDAGVNVMGATKIQKIGCDSPPPK